MRKIFFTVLLVTAMAGLSNAQWNSQTSGQTTQLSSVSAPTDNVAWICGFTGKVFRTTNGGGNWALVTNPTTADLYNIFGVDANTALTTASPGGTTGTNVYRTTNGGANWTLVFNQPTAAAFINAIWMTSATNGFMQGDPVGGRWSLWRTTNGGANWDSTGLFLTNNTEAGWNNGMFVLGTNIWFNTNAARFYYSPNSGTTWTPQTVPGSGTFGTIWFNTALNGMGSYAANLVTTANSGTTWTPLTLPGTQTINGITGSTTTWFVVRGSTAIYKSTNAGVLWTTDYTAPAGNHTHITKAIGGNRLWAIRSNGGISVSDQLIGITPISGEVPTSYSLAQNYPNPFNPTTTFSFAIPKYTYASLKVYSSLGKEVVNVYSGSLSAGKYEVNFDAQNLSTGVYFYTLNTGDFTETKKMMLVK